MRLVILTMILSLILAFSAMAGEVLSVEVQQISSKEAQIEFETRDLRSANVKIFQIPGEKPRIVVDLKDSRSKLLKSGNFKKTPESGAKAIRGAKRQDGTIRFVVDLLPGSKLGPQKQDNSSIQIMVTTKPAKAVPKFEYASTVKTIKIPDNVPIPRVKPVPERKPVIVIDAGHGGHDPGALGTKGLREKKVTLKAAIELRRQLLATGRYKVVLTRADDRYIEHDDRLRVARANSADLFISIHADATEGKTARGASVYTLADRAKNRSKRIVNSQNWIMEVNLSEQTDKVGDILVDLAQRNTLSQSTQFADLLISKLGTSTHLLRNTHRRAGYYVLLAPDVPAVLLELGFISNPTDERLLKSDAHRRNLMTSVTSAINSYFDR